MTVEQLAYLGCPDKIRAALINMGGPRLSVDEIKAKLPERRYVRGANIPDYDEDELVEPVKPRKPVKIVVTPEERTRIAALAAKIPDKATPKPYRPGEAYGAELVRYVMREMHIPRNEFFSGTRVGHVRAAGALVAVVLRRFNPETYSYPKIARIVGRRDHTTIIHAVRMWPVYAKQYPAYAELHDRIVARFAA